MQCAEEHKKKISEWPHGLHCTYLVSCLCMVQDGVGRWCVTWDVVDVICFLRGHLVLLFISCAFCVCPSFFVHLFRLLHGDVYRCSRKKPRIHSPGQPVSLCSVQIYKHTCVVSLYTHAIQLFNFPFRVGTVCNNVIDDIVNLHFPL